MMLATSIEPRPAEQNFFTFSKAWSSAYRMRDYLAGPLNATSTSSVASHEPTSANNIPLSPDSGFVKNSNWGGDVFPELQKTISIKRTTVYTTPSISIPDLVEEIRYRADKVYAEKLAARINFLVRDAMEDDPDQDPPSVGSLEYLVGFMTQNPMIKYPSVVLTPEGNFRARWKKNENHQLLLEFKKGGSVRYVAFSPNPMLAKKVDQTYGNTSIDRVQKLVNSLFSSSEFMFNQPQQAVA